MRYSDAHRLLLQVFVSKKLLSESDAQKVYVKVFERLQLETPSHGLSGFIHTVNGKLVPLFMEIRAGRAEDTGIKYYALVNTLEDDAAKFATDFTAQDIEFIKKVIQVIVVSPEGSCSSIDLINLSHDLPKKLSAQAAQELLFKLTARNWLTEKRGLISFGPRAVIELGQYLESKFKDHVNVCEMCHTVVIMGDLCNKCDTKIHKYCAATKFYGLEADKRMCPSCNELWEKDVITLPKELMNTSEGLPEVVAGPSSRGKRSKRR